MEFSPLFAHYPDFRAFRFGSLDLVCYEQIEALSVEIDTGTIWNCILSFPYPFLDQVARALNQDALIGFWYEMSDSQAHKGVG